MEIYLAMKNYGVYVDSTGIGTKSKSYKKYRNVMKEFYIDILNGKDIYIKNISNRNNSSIGKLKDFSLNYNNQKITKKKLTIELVEELSSPKIKEYDFKITLEFIDKKMIISHHNAIWLKDYAGEIILNNPKKIEIIHKPILDKFNSEMKIGDLVACVGTTYEMEHSGYSNTMVFFGHISKISKADIVYVKTFKVHDHEVVKEIRVRNNASLVLLNEKFLEKLVLSKLTYYKPN